MRKALIAVAIMAWACVAIASPPGQGGPGFGTDLGVAGSPHNLNNSGYTTPNSEVCVSCHTPHAANLPNWEGALWNHATTAETFTPYATKPGHEQPGQPTGSSKMCLSCHDGVTAVDSYGDVNGTTKMTGRSMLGTDLSDDHPIGILYPTSGAFNQDYAVMKDGGLNGKSGLASNGVQLIGGDPANDIGSGKVECRSCHHSHNNKLGNFLRTSNTQSQLCRKCHTK